MAILFERGAFENPDDPMYDDDVDTAIVVVVDAVHIAAATNALNRCCSRWWGIDGEGRHHGEEDVAFWDAQPYHDGAAWHTAKYFSDIEITPSGPAIYVDCQSLMPRAMQAAYKQVLIEELAANGITDAVVRSQYADDYLDD